VSKFDLKDEQTLTFVIVGCTAIAVLVLVIDWKIAQTILQRANELDAKLKENDVRTPVDGNSGDNSFNLYHSSSRLDGNTRVETEVDSRPDSEESFESSPWDEFPASRVNAGAGIRNMEIPKDGRGLG
jgi:hypothetical protein